MMHPKVKLRSIFTGDINLNLKRNMLSSLRNNMESDYIKRYSIDCLSVEYEFCPSVSKLWIKSPVHMHNDIGLLLSMISTTNDENVEQDQESDAWTEYQILTEEFKDINSLCLILQWLEYKNNLQIFLANNVEYNLQSVLQIEDMDVNGDQYKGYELIVSFRKLFQEYIWEKYNNLELLTMISKTVLNSYSSPVNVPCYRIYDYFSKYKYIESDEDHLDTLLFAYLPIGRYDSLLEQECSKSSKEIDC